MCLCAVPARVLVIIHLIMRVVVHTNITSTSINGITMLTMMIMVDTGAGVDPGNLPLLSMGIIVPGVEV